MAAANSLRGCGRLLVSVTQFEVTPIGSSWTSPSPRLRKPVRYAWPVAKSWLVVSVTAQTLLRQTGEPAQTLAAALRTHASVSAATTEPMMTIDELYLVAEASNPLPSKFGRKFRNECSPLNWLRL